MNVEFAAIDWTAVLVYGVPAYIAAIFAGIAAVRTSANGRKLQTSNGHTIGEMVESTHKMVKDAPDIPTVPTP